MSIADPHCHTLASDGMVTPRELIGAAVKAHLDLIAITDHDTMASVREVESWAEDPNLKVVPGQEITTRGPASTHVMGWFLDKPVRRGMSVEDTVRAIHAQGGLAIIPHPFMPVYFGSIQPGMLRRLIEVEPVDGIEMMFTVPIGRRRRRALDGFYAANQERLGAAVGGSDCHFGGHDLARVVTRYEGDFKAAVLQKATAPVRNSNRRRSVPASLRARQQWRALVELPFRRLRGEL